MDPPKFVIEASEAKRLAESAGLSVQELLARLVPGAQALARPPISKFSVAAAGLGPSGRIFIGVNLEFPGLPLHHSVHAEQFLVTNLSLNGEAELVSMAVTSAPCGHCRQFLQELRSAGDIKILVTSDKQFRRLSDFLPQRFGPHELLPLEAPLHLEAHHNALSLLGDGDGDDAAIQKLKIAALEAANKSHAPYSGSPSGVALLDSHGNIFRGSYVESAAFNPSLGPVQAALIAFVAAGSPHYHNILAAVLVEKADALVKQDHTANLLLHSISPNCHFHTFLSHSHPPSS
ncbi:hypothetical protein VNO78_10212 [Psophocarpus tetragonolobus]|uniref:cytidine deaminase n=1 Tax=Psophocarpus tetragonolobus TaxID=3891 RepID=A0AAN9XMR8_PSOTE